MAALRWGEEHAGLSLADGRELTAKLIVAADGGWGLGQVQAYRLLGMLIPKAKALIATDWPSKVGS